MSSYEAKAIILLLIMDMVTHLYFIWKLDGNKSMFPVALSYGKRKFMNLVDLNTGQRLPDIPVQVERAFYSTVLAHYRDEGFQFTEQYWKDNYKTACGFSSDGMLRDMLAKSEREGVTRRQNPTADNSTRVLASVIKLKEKINRLPASASPTAKMR